MDHPYKSFDNIFHLWTKYDGDEHLKKKLDRTDSREVTLLSTEEKDFSFFFLFFLSSSPFALSKTSLLKQTLLPSFFFGSALFFYSLKSPPFVPKLLNLLLSLRVCFYSQCWRESVVGLHGRRHVVAGICWCRGS